jgi:hypothetical protein
MARLMQIVANDTDPSFAAYLDFADVPVFEPDGVTLNPDLPALPNDCTVTFVMKRKAAGLFTGTAVTGTAVVTNAAQRLVQVNFTKAMTATTPGNYYPSWQVDYIDGRRQTHLHGVDDYIEVVEDAGGPNT